MKTITLWKTVVALVVLLSSAPPIAGQVGKAVTIVDANIATEQELAKIPGLTPALVKEIVARRPFKSVTELNAVLSKSISGQTLTDVYRRLFVHLNLNTATRDEILLIPGVGERMLHEFEEYRPYAGLPVFHREIDKYVDDAELARLEQYVFVPLDLNTASDQDILTIPGLGQRMLREFKEYRPYTNIAQFRREIGKYVDEKEVARLERYVAIK